MAAPVSGQLIRASDAFALQTWTPTWGSVSLGSLPAVEAWYQQVGQMVMWQVFLEWGAGPSMSSTMTMTLPVTAYTGTGSGLQRTYGSWIFRTSGTSHYAGTVGGFDSGGTQASFVGSWQAASAKPDQRVGVTSITPLAPVVAQTFSAGGVYRAA